MKQNLMYPIAGVVEVEGFGTLPILKIPMMDAAQETELAAKSAERWKEAG